MNIWQILCWPAGIASMVIVMDCGFNWWQAALIICIPAFFNYMDGLYRGRDL